MEKIIGTDKKKTIVSIVLFLILAASFLFGGALGENAPVFKAVVLFAVALCIWIFRLMPMSVSVLLLTALIPFSGLASFEETLAGFNINSMIFIIAAEGIGVAVCESKTPGAIVTAILKKLKSRSSLFIFIIGILITLVSGFLNNLVVCTMFSSILYAAFKDSDVFDTMPRFTKALFLTVPACSGIGGIISPAGTAANLLTLEYFKANGIEMSFFRWFLICLPVALISSSVFLAILLLVFKPERFDSGIVCATEKTDKKDRIVSVVFLMTVLGFFVGSFIPAVNMNVVAVAALAILFLPCPGILDIKRFMSSVNWDLALTIGGIGVVVSAVSGSGLFDLIFSGVGGALGALPAALALICLSLVFLPVRSLSPTATAFVAMLLPVSGVFAVGGGASAVALPLMITFWASCALLLVYTEPIYLITYKYGFFKQRDLFKVGLPVSLMLSFCVAPLIMLLVALF